MGHTQTKGVQDAPNELGQARALLRHTQFECQLTGHPDKAWVSKPLAAIKLVYAYDTLAPNTTHMHTTCIWQHPEVIDQELAKERDAGWILGPFTISPIYSLHCSGLRAIPQKNGE